MTKQHACTLKQRTAFNETGDASTSFGARPLIALKGFAAR
jgi:hypothetical protein